ncbi:MAG: helix-turn-helix transcriptional regulator [Candidatus Gastranaerophilaceae bacterium]|nr:helix-turn-helix transcriptional regulator [Candidatus Gastranaerophilaceae bacterium]
MNKQELLKKFGKNVKIERIKKDLTQEQLSVKLDVNQNYIACIERGRQNMSLGKILELSDALDVDIQKLLTFTSD